MIIADPGSHTQNQSPLIVFTGLQKVIPWGCVCVCWNKVSSWQKVLAKAEEKAALLQRLLGLLLLVAQRGAQPRGEAASGPLNHRERPWLGFI